MHVGGFWLPYAHSDEFALLFLHPITFKLFVPDFEMPPLGWLMWFIEWMIYGLLIDVLPYVLRRQ